MKNLRMYVLFIKIAMMVKFIYTEKATTFWHYIGQIYGGDFAKSCGLLRIYELEILLCLLQIACRVK